MAPPTNLVLIRKLREMTARVLELELANYDRQIKEAERAERDALEDGRKVMRNSPGCASKNEVIMLRTMQEAGTPLSMVEIAALLEITRSTISRWIISAMKGGYVERVRYGKYAVKKEVPPLAPPDP